MHKCWLALLLLISGDAFARDFFTTELTFTLTSEDIRNQVPSTLGQPLRAVYYFSDDGEVVWENRAPQRGIRLYFANNQLKTVFHVTALASIVDTILTLDSANRSRALSFMALSLDRVIPMEMPFDQKTARLSSFYQFHSPYRNEEESSYHLVVTATRPVRAIH